MFILVMHDLGQAQPAIIIDLGFNLKCILGVSLVDFSRRVIFTLSMFTGMGSMRGSNLALAQITRGNNSSPSMSAGFMGFNSTVGGGRLTPTAASSAANAVAAGFSAGGAFTGPAGLNFASPGKNPDRNGTVSACRYEQKHKGYRKFPPASIFALGSGVNILLKNHIFCHK
jgi:hypothetical protein